MMRDGRKNCPPVRCPVCNGRIMFRSCPCVEYEYASGNITKEEAKEFQIGMLQELADKRPTGWEHLLDDLE